MSKLFCLLLGVSLWPMVHAEARWCDVRGDLLGGLKYPPIALVARVSGTIIARVTFAPNGNVLSVEPVFSPPPLLFKPASAQMQQWTMKTDAVGEEVCQSLVIIDFLLKSEDAPASATPVPGIVRLEVIPHTFPLPVDPQPSLEKKHWWQKRRYVA